MEKMGIGDCAQNGLVVGILRPTLLNKPLCPFRVGASYSFPFCVLYNDIFFYGCLPLAALHILFTISVLFYGCRPLIAVIILA